MDLHIQLPNLAKLQNGYSSKFPTRIAFVWAEVFIAIILYSICWFTFGRALFEVITAIETTYTFTGQASFTVDLVKTVVAWHPVLALFGWLIYGYISSSRRSERTYYDPYV